jgi:hypothetical protein
MASTPAAGATHFVVTTIAVPVVIYGVMSRLHRLRGRLIRATARR